MDFYDINIARALSGGGGGGGSSDFTKVDVISVDADAHTISLGIKAKEAYDGTETLYFTLSQEQIDDLGWTGLLLPSSKFLEYARQYTDSYTFVFLVAGGSPIVAQGLSADDNIVLVYQ